MNIFNTMKKSSVLLFLFSLVGILPSVASDTLFVRETQIPVLIERQDNVLFMMRMHATGSRVLDEVVLQFGKEVPLSDIQAVKLYYSGTEARQDYGKNRFAPVEYITSFTPGKTLVANPSYSVNRAQVDRPGRRVVLRAQQPLSRDSTISG